MSWLLFVHVLEYLFKTIYRRSCTSFHTRWLTWYVCFFINRLKELVSNWARGHFSKSWRGFVSGKSAALTSVPPLSSVVRRSSKWQWKILRSGSLNSSQKFSDPRRPLWGKRRAGVETTCRWLSRRDSLVLTQVVPRVDSAPVDIEVRAATPFLGGHYLHPPQSLWRTQW